MPERPPTSSVLALGIDLVDHARFQQAMDRSGDRLLNRLFDADELGYCLVASPTTRLSRLAGRFAAKEAVFKALGGKLYAWHEVQVGRSPEGAPTITLNGRTRARAEALGITDWRVSISHTRDHAAAVAVGV